MEEETKNNADEDEDDEDDDDEVADDSGGEASDSEGAFPGPATEGYRVKAAPVGIVTNDFSSMRARPKVRVDGGSCLEFVVKLICRNLLQVRHSTTHKQAFP